MDRKYLTALAIVGLLGLGVLITEVWLGPGHRLTETVLVPAMLVAAAGVMLWTWLGPTGPTTPRSPVRTCPTCETRVSDGWRLCPYCGNMLDEQSNGSPGR